MRAKSSRTIVITVVVIGAVLFLWLWWTSKAPLAPTATTALRLTNFPTDFFDDLDAQSLIDVLEQSDRYYALLPGDRRVTFGAREVAVSDVRSRHRTFIERLKQQGLPSAEEFNSLFEVYESTANRVLFTGYFEATLRGSREKKPPFLYPIYRRPDDLLLIDLAAFIPDHSIHKLPALLRGRLSTAGTIIPYFDRQQIDEALMLQGRNLEIAWVDDPIAAFFLHIQGSGVIELDDGSSLGISYAETNGHPYRAIGKLLIERGFLTKENTSMQSIKTYLREHPEAQNEILAYNPSYIFFREREEGALGSLNVPLTAGRSIATDLSLFPRGALALIDIEPSTAGRPRIMRFVANQDTGGAIRGPGRVDLFTGRGEAAETLAGPLKETGRLYFLAPRAAP